MQEQFQQAYKLIFPCPACRNNFRELFCQFTCSPNQSLFLNVTETQPGYDDQLAVKTVDYSVGEQFGSGFYDSCKNVQFTATNGFALDLMAPGATDYHGLLRALGQEHPLRSPFQINFPNPESSELSPMTSIPRNCSDSSDLSSLCPCVHCPSSCSSLPPLEPPGSQGGCHVGSLTCLSFTLILAYGVATSIYILGLLLQEIVRRRRRSRQERLALSHDGASDNILSPISRTRRLVGTTSLTPYSDGDETTTGFSETHHLGRGASLLDPEDNLQPRQYRLNTVLRRAFFRLGYFCAKRTSITFILFLLFCSVLMSGWKFFGVETDPVRLWVAPNSESRLQKEFFDKKFGPFYRTEQIFATSVHGDPALSFARLRWWIRLESNIRTLRSEPNGISFQDVCFKPTGSNGECLVQSVGVWFQSLVDNVEPEKWKNHLLLCSMEPGNTECLPSYQMPLQPQFVLGGIPTGAKSNSTEYLDSKALVMTFVVNDSLDDEARAKAEEWEGTLRAFLKRTSEESETAASTSLAFSTGVSLEEEINKSTNTDIKTVVLSYLAMFAYISLTLGASSSSPQRSSPWKKLWRFFRRGTQTVVSQDTYYPGKHMFVTSRVTLGLFGIVLVLSSIASSVGFFSYLAIKSTLIIAEVIPFLVLAVGVDNIFILVHELDRQTVVHSTEQVSRSLLSPTSSLSLRGDGPYDSEGDSGPSYVTPEERIARTLAKMGPSIFLSSLTQVIAFGLGAIVPMPAVRNFAFYAAGSVFFNAVFQLTVFVSGISLDLRRREVCR
jgi:Niemann-Pick C1 protein